MRTGRETKCARRREQAARVEIALQGGRQGFSFCALTVDRSRYKKHKRKQFDRTAVQSTVAALMSVEKAGACRTREEARTAQGQV